MYTFAPQQGIIANEFIRNHEQSCYYVFIVTYVPGIRVTVDGQIEEEDSRPVTPLFTTQVPDDWEDHTKRQAKSASGKYGNKSDMIPRYISCRYYVSTIETGVSVQLRQNKL